MRVLFDYQAFQNQRYGGVSRCFAQLAANRRFAVSCQEKGGSDIFHGQKF